MFFMYISGLKKWLLDALFPPSCVICKKDGCFVCKRCLKSVLFLEDQKCPVCGTKSFLGLKCEKCSSSEFSLDGVIACTEYYKNPLLKKLIFHFKYKFNISVAEILAEILKTQFVYFSQFAPILKTAVIVPVPLHKKRLLFRDFNQSKILAEKFIEAVRKDGEVHGCNLRLLDALKRTSFKKTQAESSGEERRNNLKGSVSFEGKHRDLVKDRLIILIDDVATTCATLNECAFVLKKAGAKTVLGFVLARA